MNIPIEQLIELRKTIDSGLQGMNSLHNILILMEQWRRDELKSVDQLYKEVTSEDELTEQCGVNTSNSFNTPPKDDPGDPTAELSPAEFADLADQLEEEEPREANPVEVLIDKIMERELPDRWERLAKDAQAFLDDNKTD